MSKNLVIVESPAKAKTIAGYLGSDFVVKSSFGHIRDLVKGDKGVDIENNFQPSYEVSPEKLDTVKELRKLADKAEMVWLASDEDREGEAISWHLKEALSLPDSKIKRIVFHEITQPAILHAVANPRKIDDFLVDAQQARRVLDRLVGFELSPVLWKKVKPSLSAGRVQSVVVRLIVEREREVMGFETAGYYKVVAQFAVPFGTRTVSLKAELPKKIDTEQAATDFLNRCIGGIYTIKNLETKPAKKSPAPPFTTSTLQQEAARKMGFSVLRTMGVAQKLYEAGKITYMRTDSVNLSQTALEASKNEITSAYGADFAQTRVYKTKSANAQEAHEAIRPTYFENHTTDGSKEEQALYSLIWKRAIASQMSDAQLERTVVNIAISTTPEELVSRGEVIKFEGFLKVYLEGNDDESDENDENTSVLPPLTIGQVLNFKEMIATERFTKASPRYNEASLVQKLEELGIGRPSTYAPTITTVQKRGYVVKEDREGRERSYKTFILRNDVVLNEFKTEITGTEKAKLFPSDIGILVNDFLVMHFPNILDYQFTAGVEQDFDEIAEGRLEWRRMIGDFYTPFHSKVAETIETSSRVSGERILGEHPVSGLQVSVRMAKFGAVAQLTDLNNPEAKAQFASLRTGQNLESINLIEAIDLFKLPRDLGVFEGKAVSVALGRFGPYVKHDSQFTSLEKTQDPYTLEIHEAILLIENKRQVAAERNIKTFEPQGIQVLNGRFGPYITQNKENYKIPKDRVAQDLSLEDCLVIIETAPPKSAARKSFPKRK